jgi:4a-hydroxytetrahydrobiopterin dehydratase
MLTPEQLSEDLVALPGWTGDTSGISRTITADTFPRGIALVTAVAENAETMNHHPDIDLRWRTVRLACSTHSAGGVTQLDVELAHQILESVRAVGAEVLPAAERVEIALDCADPDAVRPFWAAGLGYQERLGGQGVELHDPRGRGPVLWFQRMDPPRSGRGRFHLDVTVPDDVAGPRVQAVLAAGGRLVTDEFAPSWWVLADAEGNELCVCTRRPAPEPA